MFCQKIRYNQDQRNDGLRVVPVIINYIGDLKLYYNRIHHSFMINDIFFTIAKLIIKQLTMWAGFLKYVSDMITDQKGTYLTKQI